MADELYDWYQKVAGLMGKTTEPLEEYNKVPIDSWMRMLGFKATPGGAASEALKRGEQARQAAELTESKARTTRGY